MANIDLNRIISRGLLKVKNFIQPDAPETVPYPTQLAAHNINNPIPLLQHRFYDERTNLYYLDDGQSPHIAFAISCQLSTQNLSELKNFLQTFLPTLPPLTTLTWSWLAYPTSQPPLQSIQPKNHQQFLFLRTPLTVDPSNSSAVNTFLDTLQRWQQQVLSTLQTFPSETPPALIPPSLMRHLIHILTRPLPSLAQQTPAHCPPDELLNFNPSDLPIEIDTDGALLLPTHNQSVYHYSIDAFPPPYFNSADSHPHPDFTDEHHLTSFLTPNIPHFQLIPHLFYHYTHISIPTSPSPLLRATHQMQSTINLRAHQDKTWFAPLIHQDKTYIDAPQFLVLSGLVVSAPSDAFPLLHTQLTTSAKASNWRISPEPFLNAALLFNAIPLQFSPQSDHSRRSSYAYFSHLFHAIGAPHTSIPHTQPSPTPAQPLHSPLPLSTINNTGQQPPIQLHHLSNTLLIGGLKSGKTALSTALAHHLHTLQLPTLFISSTSFPLPDTTTSRPAPHASPLAFFPKPTPTNTHATQLLLETLGTIYSSNSPTLSPEDLLKALWSHIDALPPTDIPSLAQTKNHTPFSWARLLSQTPLAQNPAITQLLSRNHQLLTPPELTGTMLHLQPPTLWAELPDPGSAFSAMLSTAQMLATNPNIQYLIIDDIRIFSHPLMYLFLDALRYYCTKMNISWTFTSRTPFNVPTDQLHAWKDFITSTHKALLSLPEHSVQYLLDHGTLSTPQLLDAARQLTMSKSSFDLLILPPSTSEPEHNDSPQPTPLPITIHIPT